MLVISWLADNDHKDCWLKFPLYLNLQKYCGINIDVLFPGLKSVDAQILIAVWIRSAMELLSSPYYLIQRAFYAKQLVMGNSKDKKNSFYSKSIEKKKLPLLAEYKASLKKLKKH